MEISIGFQWVFPWGSLRIPIGIPKRFQWDSHRIHMRMVGNGNFHSHGNRGIYTAKCIQSNFGIWILTKYKVMGCLHYKTYFHEFISCNLATASIPEITVAQVREQGGSPSIRTEYRFASLATPLSTPPAIPAKWVPVPILSLPCSLVPYSSSTTSNASFALVPLVPFLHLRII